MKAECLQKKGDASGGLVLVNQIRPSAGVEPLAELTADNLLAERGRELFAEGHRRNDMIRFGKYFDARWEKPDVSDEHIKLWPIPTSQIQANPNLIQNDGY